MVITIIIIFFGVIIVLVWGTIWQLFQHAIFLILSSPRLRSEKGRQLVSRSMKHLSYERHKYIDNQVTRSIAIAADVLALIATFALSIALFFWASNWHRILTIGTRGFIILSIGYIVAFFVQDSIWTVRTKKRMAI